MTKKELENLFRVHYQPMYRLALSLLADDEESRDVVSDVFVRLMDGPSLHETTARSYLLTAVRNACCNAIEHKQVRQRAERLLSAEACLTAGNDEDRLRVNELLHFADTALTPTALEIFRLRYLHGLTCREVADAVGLSRQSVHHHLTVALQAVRAYFNPKHTRNDD
ncbi:MAG: sigma-70 family RNA polymerase sigma factor [Bacteroidaceae bacterium]|nr:sigma-70 family RNA polymerase sigma factor [Bacteroidaceae bacterium]MBQ3957902.1 sigma-70 family RNA polymerase sigma factor [Bacteroidaceae bacterium]